MNDEAGSSDCENTDMVQSLSTGDQKEHGEDDEIAQDEIIATVLQYRKGSGKGEGCDKKGTCWNCCQNDLYSTHRLPKGQIRQQLGRRRDMEEPEWQQVR